MIPKYLNLKYLIIIIFLLTFISLYFLFKEANNKSVIFFHPDGLGLNSWSIIRMAKVGPDGELNYDKIKNMAIYKGHMKDNLHASSHGAATTHAYGKKVPINSYGMDGNNPIKDLFHKNKLSIAYEAMANEKSVGIINSGTITEPGTGAFLAQVKNRNNHDEIAKQIIESNADVILGGGEQYFLPKDVKGFYDMGKRTDGLNLIDLAKKKGYYVIYTKEELENLPKDVNKLLGLFAIKHSFNDKTEEELLEKKQFLFSTKAPTIAQMTKAALKILAKNKKGFLLIAEEEATDNFGNKTNATGLIESGIRADNALGEIINFIDQNPNTTLITTSDSDAGGAQALGIGINGHSQKKLASKEPINYDGIWGSKEKPFLAKKDKNGQTLPFYVIWNSRSDIAGGIIAKAYGLNAKNLEGTIDNTQIYHLIKKSLF